MDQAIQKITSMLLLQIIDDKALSIEPKTDARSKMCGFPIL